MTTPTDNELNALFAEKVAGFKPVVICRDLNGNPFPGWDMPHDYCNDANAVLPWLEQYAYRFEGGKALGCQYAVVICGEYPFREWGEGGWFRAIEPTFARAAVLALLKSKGVEFPVSGNGKE